MATFYIYHIEGVKIGVSNNPKERVKRQGFSNYEILEEHSCIYEVSRREQELQREYGYEVDRTPYYITCNNGLKATEASRNPESQLKKVRTRRSNNSFKCWATPEGRSKSSKLSRKLTFEQAEEIRSKHIPRIYTYPMLAKEYGVCKAVIERIVGNYTYKTP